MRVLLRIFLVLGCLALAGIILFAFVHRDRRPQIYFAAATGDTNAIARYLASGSNVNEEVICYVYGYRHASLLHIAAIHGQSNAVSFLLDHGANPNIRDSGGDTCLYCVVGSGQEEAGLQMLQILMEAGADPDLRSLDYGWTPLMLATVLNRTNMAQVLIAAGADVNAPMSGGSTPLHHVNGPKMARLLISAGANLNATCTWVRGYPPVTNIVTPADIALAEQRFDVLVVLTNDASY